MSTEERSWDGKWRKRLIDNIETLTKQLWQVGIREIYADGSFAVDKDHPNDIDGYFVCGLRELASADLAQHLNLLDPYKVWTWDPLSRKPYRGYPKKQLPMWHRYRIELYPHVPGLGLGSGILDKWGMNSNFRPHSASLAVMGHREASSKSSMEGSYDPQ